MRTSVPFPSVPPVSTAPLLSPDLLDLELHQLRGLLGAGLVHASRLPSRPARTAGLARAGLVAHEGPEQVLMIEGECDAMGRTFHVHDYHRARTGSSHDGATTSRGCRMINLIEGPMVAK